MSLTFKQYIYTILDVLYEDDLSKLYIKLKELNLTNYTKPQNPEFFRPMSPAELQKYPMVDDGGYAKMSAAY